MSKGLEALGTPNISKTMSAFYQMGDAPVLIRDWNDNYGKRQIELKPLRQAREEQYEIIEKELKALEIIKNCGAIIGVFETVGGKYYLETGKSEIGICKENYDLLKEVLL